jgi:Tfp pilus assembly protein PilP
MTRDASIRVLALFAALAVPLGAAAQQAASKPAGQGQAQAGKPAPAVSPSAPGAATVPAQKPPAQKPPAQKPPAPVAKPPAAAPAQVAPGAARQAAKPAAPVPAPAPDAYSYRAEGRRDPFVSLLNRGSDPRAQRKAEGLAGLLAGDAVLKGILQSRGAFLAIVQGPDAKRQLIVRTGDRFADGVVKAITADSMLILQEVNDPLSLTKQREIRKTLRAVEEVK